MANDYNFTPEVQAEILAALATRQPRIVCSVCQHWKWTMGEGFIALPLLKNFYMNIRGRGNLVGVGLVCDTCGNTLFFELGSLGLSHLVAPPMNELRKQWGLPST